MHWVHFVCALSMLRESWLVCHTQILQIHGYSCNHAFVIFICQRKGSLRFLMVQMVSCCRGLVVSGSGRT